MWSKDEENVVTIYGYGADGLEWSVCNGEYIFYHYDYRGSVVAVTNIDCTVTDKIQYDAYGSVAERTGTTEIIFGYNGKYGVLSDPNGLLYMRSRYYNPELKRFIKDAIRDQVFEMLKMIVEVSDISLEDLGFYNGIENDVLNYSYQG